LMPFSRSQNSKTAKKSAFIRLLGTDSLPGNKKVGRMSSSDFGGLAKPAVYTVLLIN
jgi:hypothetical protein